MRKARVGGLIRRGGPGRGDGKSGNGAPRRHCILICRQERGRKKRCRAGGACRREPEGGKNIRGRAADTPLRFCVNYVPAVYFHLVAVGGRDGDDHLFLYAVGLET